MSSIRGKRDNATITDFTSQIGCTLQSVHRSRFLLYYSIFSAKWPRSIVRKVGRVREKERFCKMTAVQARVRALEQASFEQQVVKLDREWLIDLDFPEVPTYWLRDEMWKTVVARPG